MTHPTCSHCTTLWWPAVGFVGLLSCSTSSTSAVHDTDAGLSNVDASHAEAASTQELPDATDGSPAEPLDASFVDPLDGAAEATPDSAAVSPPSQAQRVDVCKRSCAASAEAPCAATECEARCLASFTEPCVAITFEFLECLSGQTTDDFRCDGDGFLLPPVACAETESELVACLVGGAPP